MSCNMPINAYYAKNVNDKTGKRGLVFNRRDSYSGGDFRYNQPISVPCGKCHGCKSDQALMWSIRGYHESTLHTQNSFLTLTYDNKHLPPDHKINKKHLQDFFKRVRSSGVKLRYIACGEYGGVTKRPHYHAIIFGKDWLEDSYPVTDTLYSHTGLQDQWSMGYITIAPVTMASICYVCGYVNKKIDDEDTFNLMSRRPGIGHDWLTKYKSDIVRTGVVSIEGQQYQVPKRYLVWEEEEFEQLKKERLKYAREKNSPSQTLKNFYDARGRETNLKSKLTANKAKGKI